MSEDVKRADAMLAQISDLLRRTLRRSNAQQVPLEEEIDTVRMYLRIMQERFGDDLRVEITVDPDVAQVSSSTTAPPAAGGELDSPCGRHFTAQGHGSRCVQRGGLAVARQR